MTETKEPVFESAASEFIGHYNMVRGFIRQTVVRQRLEPFLEVDNQRVLDYGGGEALDSIWAASYGAQIDYWDNTPDMRLKAAENIFQSSEAVKVLQKDPSNDTMPRYNMLMLHVVLQYLQPKQSERLMNKLSQILMPGGLLSLMDRNWNTIEEESVGQVKHFKNGLKLNAWVFSLNYWRVRLTELGFTDISAHGVRGLYEEDRRLISEVSRSELESIAVEEKNWSTKPESIKSGRLLHILAVKQ